MTPASLTITANDAGKIYGAANPALSATYTGLVNGDSSTVVTGASLSTSATSASNVGTYGIALGAASAGNYTITEVGGTLTVTPAIADDHRQRRRQGLRRGEPGAVGDVHRPGQRRQLHRW